MAIYSARVRTRLIFDNFDPHHSSYDSRRSLPGKVSHSLACNVLKVGVRRRSCSEWNKFADAKWIGTSGFRAGYT